MTMDVRDPIILGKLSSNHTVILFDNRGMEKLLWVVKHALHVEQTRYRY